VQLCMIGANYERAAIADRERLAFDAAGIATGLRQLATIAREGTILSTCNRTEVYALFDDTIADAAPALLRDFLSTSRGVAPEVVASSTVVLQGGEAVRHLLRVACGLDSMMLGEPQILSQVQAMLAHARSAGTAGPVLSRLCHDALRTGKLARTRTGIARNRLSISHAAVDLASRQLDGLGGRSFIVIGAGQIATITARLLRNARVAEIVIANRSAERGHALAADTGGRYIPLTELPGELVRVDGLFAAAAAPQYIVGRDHLPASHANRSAPLVAVDLAVPRTIDPALEDGGDFRVFSVDDLQRIAADNRARYEVEISKVEALVAQAEDDFHAWWRERSVVPAIAALHRHAEEIRQRELQRTLRRLGHLSERDKVLVEALSSAIVNKLLHTPVSQLKQDTTVGDDNAASEQLLHLFGLQDAGREARVALEMLPPQEYSEPVATAYADLTADD
jgi:glutamyl-tRNA reductase